MTYYKSCAFANIGFANGWFKHIEFTDNNMNEFCGYDAIYNKDKKKCVGKSLNDAHCSSVHKSYPRQFSPHFDNLRAVRDDVCQKEGCGLSEDKRSCMSVAKCMTEQDKATCENDSNCTFSDRCERKNKNSSDKVLQRCGFLGWFDNTKVDVSSLCDERTTIYNVKYNVCDRK